MDDRLTSGSRDALVRWLNQMRQEASGVEDAVAALMCLKLSPTTELPKKNGEVTTGSYDCKPNWCQLADQMAFSYDRHGSQYISSCSEAVTKILGIRYHLNFPDPLLFRGEQQYGWPLIPRFVRDKKLVSQDTSKTTVACSPSGPSGQIELIA